MIHMYPYKKKKKYKCFSYTNYNNYFGFDYVELIIETKQ